MAAMEVMVDRGYDNVTIDDIGKKLGVTKGAVYWYFRNKNALIQEVSVAIEKEIELLASDPDFKRFDPLELPSSFERVFFSEQHRKDLLLEIELIASPDDKIPEMSNEYAYKMISGFEKGIEREQKSGHLHSLSDPKPLALALAVLLSGLLRGEIYAMLFLGRAKIQRTWFFAIKLFLDPEMLMT